MKHEKKISSDRNYIEMEKLSSQLVIVQTKSVTHNPTSFDGFVNND